MTEPSADAAAAPSAESRDAAAPPAAQGAAAPVAIPAALLAAIYDHARAAFPDECCGYLTGSAAAVDHLVRCTNAARAQPVAPGRGADTSFAIAGAELLAFARAFAEPAPPRIVYHSHTNGRAYFSAVDRALAAGPAYPVQHLVVGVTAAGVTEAAQFAWAADDHIEVARWSCA